MYNRQPKSSSSSKSSKRFIPISSKERIEQSYGINDGRISPLNEHQINYLKQHGFPEGIAHSLNVWKQKFALRIWIVDNSESMSTKDGHRVGDNCGLSAKSISSKYLSNRSSRDLGLNDKSDEIDMIDCSRWEEIKECVSYHVHLARMVDSATTFRLLNYPGDRVGVTQHFSVCLKSGNGPYDVQNALNTLKKVTPRGHTPITSHLIDIVEEVKIMAPGLIKNNTRVVVVIATDGLPTDENGISDSKSRKVFAGALELVAKLPVWIVIRLCTDEDKVVDYYNKLESKGNYQLEVLDDFYSEALEVYRYNPWLNYALPFHRLREMGYHDPLFDYLDERALTIHEVHAFCRAILGRSKSQSLANPETNWVDFINYLDQVLETEKRQWNPITKILEPYFNLKILCNIYGGDQNLAEI